MRLNGNALPLADGGPVRLVVPGGQCFMNINWFDHLELRRDRGKRTAETLALGRL